jgi:hypothetical protein
MCMEQMEQLEPIFPIGWILLYRILGQS